MGIPVLAIQYVDHIVVGLLCCKVARGVRFNMVSQSWQKKQVSVLIYGTGVSFDVCS